MDLPHNCLTWSHSSLTPRVHQILSDPASERYLSSISIWEVTVLLEKKRIELHEEFAKWFVKIVEDLDLQEIGLGWQAVHEMRYIIPNHKDPADRFLAATAITNDLTLVTADTGLMNVPGLKVLRNL